MIDYKKEKEYYYDDKIMDEFPELWNEYGDLITGDTEWFQFAIRLGIEANNRSKPHILQKEIYYLLKKNPEIASFLVL